MTDSKQKPLDLWLSLFNLTPQKETKIVTDEGTREVRLNMFLNMFIGWRMDYVTYQKTEEKQINPFKEEYERMVY